MSARVSSQKFFVTVTAAVDDLLVGDHLLVDPGAMPGSSDYVLRSGRIERFSGQDDIRGTVIAAFRDVPRGGREGANAEQPS